MNPTLPDAIFGNYGNQPVQPQAHQMQNMNQMNMGAMQSRMSGIQPMAPQMRGISQLNQMGQMAQMPPMNMQAMNQQMSGVIPPSLPQMSMHHMQPQSLPQIPIHIQQHMQQMQQPMMGQQYGFQGQQQRMMPQPQVPMPAMQQGPMIGQQMALPPIPPSQVTMPSLPTRPSAAGYIPGSGAGVTGGRDVKRRHQKGQKMTSAAPPGQFSSGQSTPVAPTSTRPPSIGDGQQLMELMEQLSEDRMDLFVLLFDADKTLLKRSDDRIERFVQFVMQTIAVQYPNSLKWILFMAEQFRVGSELYQFLSDPPAPAVFTKKRRAKVFIKPLAMNLMGFEMPFLQKTRKEADTFVIGYIYSPIEPIGVASCIVDRVESMGQAFGETRPSFCIAKAGKLPARVQIQIGSISPPFMSWFIVMYVTYKPIDTLVRELFSIPTDVDITGCQGKTMKCRNCSFDIAVILEILQREGAAGCPICGAPVMIGELKHERRSAAPPQTPPVLCRPEVPPEPEKPVVIPEDPEMKRARLQLREQMSSLLRIKGRPILSETLFDSPGMFFDCE